MSDFNIGIVGTGSIASCFSKAIHRVPGCCAYGVSSRTKEKGNVFAIENDIKHVYAGIDLMLADPNIDLVYIAVPHPFHYENALKAVEAGKAVLCEKPICISGKQAETLFEKARDKRVFIAEGMWTRYLPTSQKALQWIRDGRIGEIKFIDGCFSFAVDPVNPKPRLVDPDKGGGAMFDLGVYTVEMASFYARALPSGYSGFNTSFCYGTDASSVLALKYPNDILATLRMGIVCETSSTMTIFGTKGRIEIPGFCAANDVYLFNNDRAAFVEDYHATCDQPQGFTWQIEAVKGYVENGYLESPVITQEESIVTAKILGNMMHQFYPNRY